ncbi:HAF repeat-containing protein [Massilia sp. DJPM01]|uniref:PEP-CTERM sorting domain-containing protein n=1 Tax=Massilia sp. DJPM01 TaxID=3024404 RepID=UPI00259F2BEF|nr:PEP-CTERM sorting domain-containing protein [Massilia sp. DJPM01]MDM5179307.1 HAF repeat-containing protein [Massilia sp. DJPM01]
MFAPAFLFAFALAPLASVAASRYALTPLPPNTNPLGINNAGQIVGDHASEGGRRGFVWSGGTLAAIGTFGGPDSSAAAINQHGQATGHASLPGGEARAFRYAGGKLAALAIPASTDSLGAAINDAGLVAGQYQTGTPAYRAFLYSGAASTDLGTLGGGFAYAAGINNGGQVVGVAALDQSSPYLAHAFLYANGKMSDLGTLGGSYSAAAGINDAGTVVGNAWVQGSEHAFVYAKGKMTDLGTLGGRRSYANAVNLGGQVVGRSDSPGDAGSLAFLYEGAGLIDINTLIDPALGYTVLNATGINDRGQIAAYGCRNGGSECGGLLLQPGPAPEAATWAMLLAGLGVLGWCRLRTGRMT